MSDIGTSVVEQGRQLLGRPAAVPAHPGLDMIPMVVTLLNTLLTRVDALEQAVATSAGADAAELAALAEHNARLEQLHADVVALQLAVTAPRVRRPVRDGAGEILYVVDEVGGP